MPKPKRPRLNKKQSDERVKRGRGNPKSANYEPFLRIHDFSSLGRVSRIRYEGREIHTMSDLETAVLSELFWSENIDKIFDQAALGHKERHGDDGAERYVTERIAEQIGVKHPILPDGSPAVMTTDFLVVLKGGEVRALSVKPLAQITRSNANDATDRSVRRTIEKLEIERRYWIEFKAKWFLVTDADVSKTRKMNIELLLSTPRPDFLEHDQYWVERLSETIEVVDSNKHQTLANIARILTPQWLSPIGRFVENVRLLCAHRFLEFDLDRPFSPTMKAGEFRLGSALADAAPGDAARQEAA